MIGKKCGAALAFSAALAAMPFLAPVAARAQTFTAPSQLGPAFTPPAIPGASTAAGMAPGGTALVVWKSQAFGASWSMHKPGGAWTIEKGNIPIAGGANLQLHMNKDGSATLASVDHAGHVMAAPWRPGSDTWDRGLIVAQGSTGTPIILVGNANGAKAIFYDSGNQVMAVRNAGGFPWGTPEVVATVPAHHDFAVAAAAMNDAGDMVVAWQQWRQGCRTSPCVLDNYQVYAARELAASPGWVPSPRLSFAGSDPWGANAVIDPLGRAGLLLLVPTRNDVWSVRQQANGSWGALGHPALRELSGGTFGLWGASIGPHDQVTIGASDLNTTNSVVAADGNIVTQSWGAPVNLSLTDASPPTAGLAYGGNRQGAAALEWVDLDDTVRATLRASATSAFPPAETVIAGDGCTVTGTGAACRTARRTALNAAGDAVVVYRQTDASGATAAVWAATTN